MGHVILTTPLLTVICPPMLGRDIAYRCTKFDHSSFSCSRDMVGAHQNLNGSRDLTTLLLGMICHSWARTCYYQPGYQFEVSISAHYKDRKRNSKCGKWSGLG